MKRLTRVLLIGAAACGLAAYFLVLDANRESIPVAGAACGFAVSVGLLGIAAALSERNGTGSDSPHRDS